MVLKELNKSKKGFTLAELLIVVAIIAVLVAISIPVFNSQLEKARRAVDLHTASATESVLVASINDGTIQIPSPKDNQALGVWVLICRDEESWPKDYNNSKQYKTVFYGANKGIIINNSTNSNDWNKNNAEIRKILKAAGMNEDSLKVKSKGKQDGWDWIVIQAGYLDKKIFTKIYSGFKGKGSGASESYNKNGNTNIEKMIG